jgi:hypothetical protein
VFSFSIGAEGLFNRMGTGTLQLVEAPELCCGTVTPELFHRVASGITTDILRWKGSHTLPVQKGRRCELFLAILFKGGQEWTTRWQYGSESDGPPPEISLFMRRAVELTDPRPDRRDIVEGRETPEPYESMQSVTPAGKSWGDHHLRGPYIPFVPST